MFPKLLRVQVWAQGEEAVTSPVPVAFYPPFPPFDVELWCADARYLSFQSSESVHCVVTSPPYWGLRDYGLGSDALGLEPTIDLYVQHIVEIFREVRRVLRPDGTLWLVMGDSYVSHKPRANSTHTSSDGKSQAAAFSGARAAVDLRGKHPVLKDKDLCGVPWRAAFALQADGWWLRSDIIWSKPNPMPESVTDRPTKAHEYLFLLTKSAKYYYDIDAVREPHSDASLKRYEGGSGYGVDGIDRPYAMQQGLRGNPNGRNKRSVWHLPTQSYKGAHFATFPQKLVEPCILAGTSERGVCPECGAPWERVVERVTAIPARHGDWKATGQSHRNDIERKGGFYDAKSETTGWHPTCACGHEDTVPATVLDPFGGSGTVGVVANQHGRKAILVELNREYCDLAASRLSANGK